MPTAIIPCQNHEKKDDTWLWNKRSSREQSRTCSSYAEAQWFYTGTGQVEALKGNLSGYWSRRIDKFYRIIYTVEEEVVTVTIISAKGHYGDKWIRWFLINNVVKLSRIYQEKRCFIPFWMTEWYTSKVWQYYLILSFLFLYLCSYFTTFISLSPLIPCYSHSNSGIEP